MTCRVYVELPNKANVSDILQRIRNPLLYPFELRERCLIDYPQISRIRTNFFAIQRA
jgi:hypothetical protein